MNIERINTVLNRAIISLQEGEVESMIEGAYMPPPPSKFGFDKKPKQKGGLIGREWDAIDMRSAIKKKIVAIQDGKVFIQRSNRTSGYAIVDLKDIEKEIAFDTKEYASYVKNIPIRKKEAEKEAQEKAAKVSLDGFENTLSHRMRGRAVKALTTKGRWFQGEPYQCIRDFIREKIKEGWHVEGHGPKRELTSPKGRFFIQKDITKLGMDYAKYLDDIKYKG